MLSKGTRWTSCNECGKAGQVQIVSVSPSRVVIRDRIPHAASCSLKPKTQAAHFRNKAWVRQEKKANALVGTRETVASGAANEDGDGRSFYQWRVESKGTNRPFFLLRQDTWTKLVRGALAVDEEPVLHIEVRQDRALMKSTLVVVRQELYAAAGWPWKTLRVASLRNPKSHRITPTVETPFFVDLDPVGIALSEAEFRRLKEKLDDAELVGGSDLPGS